MPTCILAIESSCDDTSCAVCVDGKILSNEVATQHIHEQYGGVVPELASRSHLKNIVPVVDIALKKAQVELKDINAVAFTRGPGLLGSLLVGGMFAKAMAQSLDVPLIDVHHIQAHILAHFIDEPKPKFPFLCLTVSGGHTQLVIVKDYLEMEIIGQTIDDAVGEAFDKTAKMLGLPYPGGPLIDKYAQSGDVLKFPFSEPKIPELNFSFSGFKTQVLYFLQKQEKLNPNFIQENLADICASIQHTIIEILMDKIKLASKQTGITQIAIGGGVSANSGIREALKNGEETYGWKTFIPKFEYTTDNAAMIAIVGYLKYLEKDFAKVSVVASARLRF